MSMLFAMASLVCWSRFSTNCLLPDHGSLFTLDILQSLKNWLLCLCCSFIDKSFFYWKRSNLTEKFKMWNLSLLSFLDQDFSFIQVMSATRYYLHWTMKNSPQSRYHLTVYDKKAKPFWHKTYLPKFNLCRQLMLLHIDALDTWKLTCLWLNLVQTICAYLGNFRYLPSPLSSN